MSSHEPAPGAAWLLWIWSRPSAHEQRGQPDPAVLSDSGGEFQPQRFFPLLAVGSVTGDARAPPAPLSALAPVERLNKPSYALVDQLRSIG